MPHIEYNDVEQSPELNLRLERLAHSLNLPDLPPPPPPFLLRYGRTLSKTGLSDGRPRSPCRDEHEPTSIVVPDAGVAQREDVRFGEGVPRGFAHAEVLTGAG